MLLWVITAVLLQHSKNTSANKDMWGWSCVNNQRSEVYSDKINYQLVCRLQNWSLICMIIEIVVEVISVALYSVLFYRYYSKRRLHKSMDMRDRARSDLYLAQLRTQSAPNTPGFGPKSPAFSGYYGPKSPAFSQYAMSPRHPPAAYRNLADIEEGNPFTPGGKVPEPQSMFTPTSQSGFKLQAPPVKAPSATPKMAQESFTPTTARGPSPHGESSQQHAPVAANEPTYDAVPIPGAYAGAAVKSPPPQQTTFGLAQ